MERVSWRLRTEETKEDSPRIDHAGPIRVVTIEGVDSNMCCGTHVSNLSDLQVSEEGRWSVCGQGVGEQGWGWWVSLLSLSFVTSELKRGVWSLLPLCPKTHCGVCVSLCVTPWCRSLRFWGLRKGKRTKAT